jgi:hypothetical protein
MTTSPFCITRGSEGYYLGRVDIHDLSKVDRDGFPPLVTILDIPPSAQNKDSVEKWALYVLNQTRQPNPPLSERLLGVVSPPIFNAINLGLTKVVQRMVELNVPKDLKATWTNETPLEAAKRSGNPDIIRILEEYYST